jgi:cell wall-associated NlpC family hydrolase
MLRIFAAAGKSLPRTSREQWKIGVHVALSDLRPGDLLFWAYDTGNPASIHHVAMYIGHGLMVQAPHTGGHVEVSPVYLSGLVGAVRPL